MASRPQIGIAVSLWEGDDRKPTGAAEVREYSRIETLLCDTTRIMLRHVRPEAAH
jgi:hypothetical protein